MSSITSPSPPPILYQKDLKFKFKTGEYGNRVYMKRTEPIGLALDQTTLLHTVLQPHEVFILSFLRVLLIKSFSNSFLILPLGPRAEQIITKSRAWWDVL